MIDIVKCIATIVLGFTLLSIAYTTDFVGEEIEENVVTSEYDKNIKSIIIEHNKEYAIYVTYDIILLGKENKVLYKAEYRKELKPEDKLYNNLEDIKPDYIQNSKIEKMDIELKSVNEPSDFVILSGLFGFSLIFSGIICLIYYFKC